MTAGGALADDVGAAKGRQEALVGARGRYGVVAVEDIERGSVRGDEVAASPLHSRGLRGGDTAGVLADDVTRRVFEQEEVVIDKKIDSMAPDEDHW